MQGLPPIGARVISDQWRYAIVRKHGWPDSYAYDSNAIQVEREDGLEGSGDYYNGKRLSRWHAYSVELAAPKPSKKEKLRYSLLPFAALPSIVRVMMHGAKKHGVSNWKETVKGPEAEALYLDKILRHVTAFAGGQKIDPESGESHLAHAVCDAMFLLAKAEEEPST